MKIFFIVLLILLISFNNSAAFAKESPLIKTIAILDFENNTGMLSHEGLKKGLSDSLTNSLTKYEKLSILERSRLKDALAEVSLGQSGLVSAESASKIGKLAGTQYVILGSVSRLGDTHEVSVRLVDVESSKILFAQSVRCADENIIYKAVDYLSLEIAKKLGEDVDPRVIDQARKDVETFAKQPENNNLPLWIGGSVLGAAALTGVVITIIVLTRKNTNNVQNVCVGSNCNTSTDRTLRRNFGFEF